VGILEKFV